MRRSWTLTLLIALPAACRPAGTGRMRTAKPRTQEEAEGWAVTAWSEHYELFAETDPLIAGREAPSHAHFTYLPDFSALNEGSVTGILRGADGREESFLSPKPLRAGIFNVDLQARARGDVRPGLPGPEPARRARTSPPAGCAWDPRRLPAASPSRPRTLRTRRPPPARPVGFLKEQQWRTAFATEWAREGTLQAESARLRQRSVPRPAGRRP